MRDFGKGHAKDGMVSKASVDYRPGYSHMRCRNCTMFRAPDRCTLVVGDINPDYLCNEFKPKVRK